MFFFFFFQAEDGIRDGHVTGVQTCALPILVVDVAAGQWWSIEDVNGDFSLASFNASTPAPSPDRLIYTGHLLPGTSFGPLDGWGAALPQPYSGIPTGYTNIVLADGGSGGVADISVDGGSSAPNFKYCSFCDTSSQKGSITFRSEEHTSELQSRGHLVC